MGLWLLSLNASSQLSSSFSLPKQCITFLASGSSVQDDPSCTHCRCLTLLWVRIQWLVLIPWTVASMYRGTLMCCNHQELHSHSLLGGRYTHILIHEVTHMHTHTDNTQRSQLRRWRLYSSYLINVSFFKSVWCTVSKKKISLLPWWLWCAEYHLRHWSSHSESEILSCPTITIRRHSLLAVKRDDGVLHTSNSLLCQHNK